MPKKIKMNVKPITETNSEFEVWLKQKPASIKDLAKEFPLGVVWRIDDQDMVIIGWNESNTILFSKLSLSDDQTPNIDKMFSREERIYICADHLRADKNRKE